MGVKLCVRCWACRARSDWGRLFWKKQEGRSGRRTWGVSRWRSYSSTLPTGSVMLGELQRLGWMSRVVVVRGEVRCICHFRGGSGGGGVGGVGGAWVPHRDRGGAGSQSRSKQGCVMRGEGRCRGDRDKPERRRPVSPSFCLFSAALAHARTQMWCTHTVGKVSLCNVFLSLSRAIFIHSVPLSLSLATALSAAPLQWMSWPDSAPPLHWVLLVSLPELFKSWDPHKCLSSPHTPSRSTFSFSPSHCLPPSLPPPPSGRPSFPSLDGCSYFPWLGLFGAKRRLMKRVSLGHRRRMTGKTLLFSFRGCFIRFWANIEVFHTSVLLHFHTSSFIPMRVLSTI